MFKFRFMLMIAALLATTFMFTSCDKDEDLSKGSLAVTISGLPSGASGKVTITGPSGFSQTITAGETLADLATGTYTVTTEDVSTSEGPYSAENGKRTQTATVEGAKTTTATVMYGFKGHEYGIEGEWISAGADVAPLLLSFSVDSIYAKFNADLTYTVESFDQTGTKTTYTGTYTQTQSGTANIFTITINQSTPSTLISEGILEVYNESPNKMLYEIAQTSPSLGLTAPTPTGGFGSTSGGLFGTTNIQTFRRVK